MITLLAYESHNHRSSRKGPRRLAGGNRHPHGSRPGSDCARALAKGQSRSAQPPVHAAVPQQGVLRVVKGIADTGFLVAFVNRADEHHDWAVSIAEQVTEPLLTCEPVLAEAAFHLQNVPLVLALVREGLVTLAFTCNDHLAQLEALALRYADRHPDLADLCLIRLSELFPGHSVITVDRQDFRVYRRNKREMIPPIS